MNKIYQFPVAFKRQTEKYVDVFIDEKYLFEAVSRFLKSSLRSLCGSLIFHKQ